MSPPDPSTKRRVVQWSTGACGSLAIAALARRPDLELVGTWVHDPAKVGRDVGELSGGAPIGVRATDDADALLALAPDCVCYTAIGESRPEACLDDLCRILRAGVNVVSTSVPGLIHAPAYDPGVVARLEAACLEGDASLYMSGIEPGFVADHLVAMLSTGSSEIESIRTQELFSYSDYPVSFTMFEFMGFGKPEEHVAILEQPGIQTSIWGPPIRMVADVLGVELDGIRETYEKRVTPRPLDVAAGHIEAGTVGALRFETIGVVDGRDAIVIEHVNRMALDLAPDWPIADRDGVYRIEIEGNPKLDCELRVGTERNFSDQGLVVTTMRAVNAIPYVCDATSGIKGAMDLPLTVPVGAM
ncbi:MAG: dihydrodipicolinate reductase [bacterium]|nr:dihydrodipicolinate reductase [bacterium]